jgi:glyoxylase-like metal-dependent hydrolase (beta-lactamase superfamily II)
MKSTAIKIAYAVLAVLFLAATISYAAQAQGQRGGAGAGGNAPQGGGRGNPPQVTTTKVTDKFYTLAGQGGTIGFLIGPDGVFMVDTQSAAITDRIVAAIKAITPSPIRFIVNTHVHADHTGGNENFGKLGAILLSRDELRARLAQPTPPANPSPAPALPMVTFNGRVTFHMNGEDIELIPIPRAHTDGDTLVRFPGPDVLMTGDYFRSENYPNIDRANGGSLNGMLQGLALTIGLAGPNTKIVPGHGPTTNRAAVQLHRDMILSVRDKVTQLIKEGRTMEQIIAAKPTAEWDMRVPAVTQQNADRFVGQLYAELAPPAPPAPAAR